MTQFGNSETRPGVMQQATHSNVALELWLAIATKGLCEKSVERIRNEITSHYASKIDATRELGSQRPAAEKLALESLGDPDEAYRRFKLSHLTRREEKLYTLNANSPLTTHRSMVIPTLAICWVFLLCFERRYVPDRMEQMWQWFVWTCVVANTIVVTISLLRSVLDRTWGSSCIRTVLLGDNFLCVSVIAFAAVLKALELSLGASPRYLELPFLLLILLCCVPFLTADLALAVKVRRLGPFSVENVKQ